MRHLVVVAHPDRASLNLALAETYAKAVRAWGDSADVRDLYRSGFDPRLGLTELPWREDFQIGADAMAERAALAAADVLAFVYPLWFNAPPAMLKGWCDRVLGMGFAYEAAEPGARPLLTGKRLVSITTSGAPSTWADQTGALARLRAGFDEHLAGVTGLAVVEHLHLGGATPGIRAEAVADMLAEVAAMARRRFRPATV